MNITIKNLKTSEFASHETLCFEATLNIDGFDVAIAENDGQGGCVKYTLIGEVKDSTLTRNRVLFNALKAAAIAKDPEGFEQLDALIYETIEAL